MGFGYEGTRIAVRADAASGVAEAMELVDPVETGWSEGPDLAYEKGAGMSSRVSRPRRLQRSRGHLRARSRAQNRIFIAIPPSLCPSRLPKTGTTERSRPTSQRCATRN